MVVLAQPVNSQGQFAVTQLVAGGKIIGILLRQVIGPRVTPALRDGGDPDNIILVITNPCETPRDMLVVVDYRSGDM